MSLTELSQRLLFNSIVEVWVALCKDSDYDWQNKRAFNLFVTFIKKNNLKKRFQYYLEIQILVLYLKLIKLL